MEGKESWKIAVDELAVGPMKMNINGGLMIITRENSMEWKIGG